MKLVTDHTAPPDAEVRRGIAPVICYPVEGLPRPDLAPFRAARAGWERVAEVVVPAREARCYPLRVEVFRPLAPPAGWVAPGVNGYDGSHGRP